MADEAIVDGHLVAVLNRVLDLVYQTKQVAWAASTSPARADLEELKSFLIDQSGRFMVAEERIGGRSPDLASPSSHNRGNLMAEAGDDHAAAVSLLAGRLRELAEDARTRAATIAGAPAVSILVELAAELEARAGRLGSR